MRQTARSILKFLSYLLLFLIWNVLASLCLLLSIRMGYPLVGLAATIGLYVLLLWRLALHQEASSRVWALLRLRPLDNDALRWTAAAVPVLLLLSWSLGEVYVRLVPVPPETFNPFQELMRTARGRLAVTVLAVGIAPVLEEFFFRGFMQRMLERHFGTVAGITGAAAVFAAVHVLPWIFPLHFFLGLAFGYAVYATRSIWAGVILHAANNAAAVAGLGLEGEEPTPTPTLWQVGPDLEWWASLAILAASAALAYLVARRMHKAGRERSLRLPLREG